MRNKNRMLPIVVFLVLIALSACQSTKGPSPSTQVSKTVSLEVRPEVKMGPENWVALEFVEIEQSEPDQVYVKTPAVPWGKVMSYQGRIPAEFFQIEITSRKANIVNKEYPPALENDRIIFGFSSTSELSGDTGGFLTQIVFMENGAYLELYTCLGEYQILSLNSSTLVPTDGPIYFQGERQQGAWKFSLISSSGIASEGYVPFDLVAADAFNRDLLSWTVGVSSIAPSEFELSLHK